MKKRNLLLRLSFLIILIIPLFFLDEFYRHFDTYIIGQVNAITSEWYIVVLNIVGFVLFLIPLSFRRKIDWKEYGLVTAFFVSLFVEMYGIPLTIFLSSRYFQTMVSYPPILLNISLLGVGFGMDHAMVYASILIILGMLLILVGWATLYFNVDKQKIVKTGVYSYSRHPQYFGFILLIVGWFIGWPTLLTWIFTPILVYKYWKVSINEEKEIGNNKYYNSYKKEVPFFV